MNTCKMKESLGVLIAMGFAVGGPVQQIGERRGIPVLSWFPITLKFQTVQSE
jgi:hypothetical protein